MINKKRAVLLISDYTNLFVLGTFIFNLMDKFNNFDKLFIIENDIPDDICAKLKRIDKRIEIIKYYEKDFVEEFKINLDRFKQTDYYRRYTLLTSLKFFIFKFLDEYDQVIFFDTDMLIKYPIDEIINYDYNIAWRSDKQSIYFKIIRGGMKDEELINIDEYEDYKKINTPNGGFFIVNNNFDFKKAYEIAKRYLIRACSLHPYSIIETLFGYVVAKLKLKVLQIDADIYNVYINNVKSYSKLIHFIGEQYKPWHSSIIQNLFPQWIEYYKKFESTIKLTYKVQTYENTNTLILNDYYLNKWTQILNKLIYPKYITIKPIINNKIIQFTYINSIDFFIETEWLFNRYKIGLIINKDLELLLKNLCSQILQELNNHFDYSVENKIEETIIRTDWMNEYQIWKKFNQFIYLVKDRLNEILNNNILEQLVYEIRSSMPIEVGYLKSYHNKFLDIVNDNLEQIGYEFPKKLYTIKLHKYIILINIENHQFINAIYPNGKISFSKQFYTFNLESEINHFYIKIKDTFLTANHDKIRNVKLTFNRKNWEKFTIKIK